jgi:hypothetical protein
MVKTIQEMIEQVSFQHRKNKVLINQQGEKCLTPQKVAVVDNILI